MMGYSEDEISAAYTDDGLFAACPGDRAGLQEKIIRSQNDEKPHQAVYRMLTKSGTYKWVSTNYNIFRLGDRKYIYVVYTDIDPVKRQEQELVKQYAAVQSYIDSMAGTYLATMRADISSNTVETTGGIRPLFLASETPSYDCAVANLLLLKPRQKDRKDFLRHFSRQALTAAYAAGDHQPRMDYLFRPDDRSTLWVRRTANLTLRPGSGDLIAFFTVSDISRDKTIELIMNNIIIQHYDFVSCIDIAGNSIQLVSINQQSAGGSEVHGGENYDGIMRGYVEKHVVPEEKEACIKFMSLDTVTAALATASSCSGSFTVNENGVLRNKRLDYSYIDRESGMLSLIRSDFTDIQKKQIEQEEQLRAALLSARQASVAKSEFLSHMSHEIRTPMNAIIGLDTIALREKDLSPSMEDHLKKIGISARFLLSLINDILDMSRIESGRMLLNSRDFEFRSFIDNINTIVYAQCRERGIDYECIIKGAVDSAYVGDATKLQQVVLNILGNSVKFTPAGGKIHFMVEELSHDGETARMRFTMADTGRGIDEKFLPHIFDSFAQEDSSSTTSYGGSGLGLAITKNLVDLMDGTIDVHSIKGMGSDFTVEVNLGLSAKSISWNQTKNAAAGSVPLSTLIVDDDIAVCQHAQIVLGDAGFKSEYVCSGSEALRLVREHHDSDSDFSLILLDWKMPDMDGIETAREIRKIAGPEVTIIILTAYDWSEIEQKALAAGVDCFVRKPVFASSILEAYASMRGGGDTAEGAEPHSYNFSGKKLLLAEDNAINSEIARSLLESVGFTVDTASNGVEAIQLFTKSAAGEYAALLMDIRMPLMDGLEATKVIRSVKKDDAKTIPIIAMSANAFEEDVRTSLECGMNAHLTKPVEAELMYETLARLIR